MASIRKRRWTHKGIEREAWVLDYTEPGGKRRQRTFEKKKDADAYRNKLVSEIQRGEYLSFGDTWSVAQAGEAYLRHMEGRQAAGAIGRSYVEAIEQALRLSVNAAIGDKLVNELRFADMGSLVDHMRRQGLSARTIAFRKAQAMAVERFAFKMGKTLRRSLSDASRDFPAGRKGKVRAPTKAEIVALLNAIDQKRPGCQLRTMHFLRIAFLLASMCSLRYGEICGLKKDDCDLDAGIVRVRNNVTRHGELKTTKTVAGIRDVPLPSYLAGLIREWLRRDWRPNPKGLLLTTPNGNPVSTPSFHAVYWYPLLKAAGLPWEKGADRLHFHALRHFAGSWWLGEGMSVPLVSKLMGHANPSITMSVYAHELHTADERKRAVFAASESLLDLKKSSNVATTEPNTLILLG